MKSTVEHRYEVGDRVLTFRDEIGTITRVYISVAYEIESYQAPYQPDEIKRKLPDRKRGRK